jgi:hypothetical protein
MRALSFSASPDPVFFNLEGPKPVLSNSGILWLIVHIISKEDGCYPLEDARLFSPAGLTFSRRRRPADPRGHLLAVKSGASTETLGAS